MTTHGSGRGVGALRVAGALVVLLAVLGGCGGNDPPQDLSAEELVGGLVGSMSDYVSSPENFRYAFAEGAAPPESERPRYREHRYTVKSIRVSGDQGEVRVEVADSADSPVGEVTWTAARQGDEWKLTSAPLP